MEDFIERCLIVLAVIVACIISLVAVLVVQPWFWLAIIAFAVIKAISN